MRLFLWVLRWLLEPSRPSGVVGPLPKKKAGPICSCCKAQHMTVKTVRTGRGDVELSMCPDCDVRTCKATSRFGTACTLAVPNIFAKRCPAGHPL